jgi:hypothetical protein
VTTLDGNYYVVTLPPSTFCTLTITNLYHATRNEYTDAVEGENDAENKSYD